MHYYGGMYPGTMHIMRFPTVIEGLCESSNELRIAFWFQMLEQKLRMGVEVLEVRKDREY